MKGMRARVARAPSTAAEPVPKNNTSRKYHCAMAESDVSTIRSTTVQHRSQIKKDGYDKNVRRER